MLEVSWVQFEASGGLSLAWGCGVFGVTLVFGLMVPDGSTVHCHGCLVSSLGAKFLNHPKP